MQAGNTSIEGRLFPGFGHDLLDRLGLILDHFFDMSGMNTAVHCQPGQCPAGNLAADRVKARDGDRFGGIVNNHIHTCGLFKGADVATVTAHDAAFHLFIRKRNHRRSHFGQVLIAPYPAASLNGEVNAFLTNNVLYSRLTSEVTNTARVRYYDRRDNTPTLAFTNYVYADTGTNAAQPLTREPHSYSRLNLEDDLKWQPNRTWTFGLGYFFERYTYQNGEVDATNESGAKAFINMTPWSWLTGRASVQYSQRRYDNWLATATDPAANAMRQFFVQNRDMTKASGIFEIQLTKDLTVSPNGSVRWIEYPTDAVIGASNLVTNSLGTQSDRSWNVGADFGIRITPELRATFGYNYEEHLLYMQSCCGAAIPFNDSNKWSTQIAQHYNTFVVSGLWNAIPGKLDILADYVLSISNEANSTIGCSSGNTGCTGNNSAGFTPPWPDEKNYFQRFNVVTKYYVDPSVVKQMGFVGNITLKGRYTFEKNANTNWATDNFTPYSPSAADAGGTDITNGGRSLFLAYNNPNYTAQILALSVVAQW